MTVINAPIPDPQLEDFAEALKRDIFRSLHAVMVGEVVSYDATKGTARVKILFKRVLPSGAAQSRGILVNVPVVTMQGGGGALQFPITAGDQCVLLFADRNIDAWTKDGGEAVPPSDRCHDLSDAIALVGINCLRKVLPAPGGVKLSLGGATILLTSGKIVVANETTDLLTLVLSLFTVLAALKTTTNLTLHADSLTALTALQVQFESLFGVAP